MNQTGGCGAGVLSCIIYLHPLEGILEFKVSVTDGEKKVNLLKNLTIKGILALVLHYKDSDSFLFGKIIVNKIKLKNEF